MKNILKMAWVLGLFSVLLGCGGGGGDARAPGTLTNNLSLAVVDSFGHVVNGISYAGVQRIRATYTDSSGAPINNTLISFSVSTNTGAATLGDTTATTTNGQAFVSVSPATATSSGAATVTATVGGLTSTVDFSITGTTASLGALVFGSNPLVASGNTSVKVPVTASGSPASGVNISFSASCGALSPVTTTSGGDGYASANYSAVRSDGTSCSGATTITATGPGSSSSTGNLTVSTPVASAINFVAASPAQIFVTGSGASSQSVLKFKVLDASGIASAGIPVQVSLQQNPGGVGLNAVGSAADITSISDSNGVVTFTVFAGSIPGPVQVKAYLPGSPAVYAYSTNLTVQNGPPSQKHFSVSVSTFNVEGRDWDGTTTTLTARVADRQGNAAPAGTVVNFTSSGGQIAGSCAVTVSADGIASCTAAFSSQNPRIPNGRVAVLAYTEGLKEYVDVNGNGVFDFGVDTLVDMGDAYRDDDESGTFNANLGEFVVPRGGTGTCPGSGWPVPKRLNTCDSSTAATTVRQQVMLIMSGSGAYLSGENVTSSSVSFHLTDDNGLSGNGTALNPMYVNPMPYGTTVVAEAIDNTPGGVTCTVLSTFPSVVKNIAPTLVKTEDLGTDHKVKLKDCNTDDQVRITVTTPRGTSTYVTYTLP